MKRSGKLLAILLALILLLSSMSAFATNPSGGDNAGGSTTEGGQGGTTEGDQGGTTAPNATQVPSGTPAPDATQVPSGTPAPDATQVPSGTPAPDATQVPSGTPAPDTSATPAPDTSAAPDDGEDDEWWEEDWEDDWDDDFIDFNPTPNADAYIVSTETMRATGTISGDVVNVREAPSTKAGLQQKAYKGAQVLITATVLATDDFYWYKINFNGKTGYVRADFITRGANQPAAETTPETEDNGVTALPEGSTGVITSGTVNVRAEASTKSDVVTKVNRGAEITVSGSVTTDDGFIWYQVTANGKTGFVREDLIDVTIPESEEAPVEETTDTPASALIPDADQLAALSVDQAYLTHLSELNDTAQLHNMENLLTPMEILVFKSLPTMEQMLVILSAIGYADEVDTILTSVDPAIELSKHAQSMVDTFSARIEQMSEDERSLFDTLLTASCPTYTLLIGEEMVDYHALVLTVDDNQVVYYGLYLDAETETWMIIPFVAGE